MNIVKSGRFLLWQHGDIDIRHCSSVRKIAAWSQRDDICLSDRAAAAAATRLCTAMTGRNLRGRRGIRLFTPLRALVSRQSTCTTITHEQNRVHTLPKAAALGGEPDGRNRFVMASSVKERVSNLRLSLKAARQLASDLTGICMNGITLQTLKNRESCLPTVA